MVRYDAEHDLYVYECADCGSEAIYKHKQRSDQPLPRCVACKKRALARQVQADSQRRKLARNEAEMLRASRYKKRGGSTWPDVLTRLYRLSWEEISHPRDGHPAPNRYREEGDSRR